MMEMLEQMRLQVVAENPRRGNGLFGGKGLAGKSNQMMVEKIAWLEYFCL